jgi:hypothetical protein
VNACAECELLVYDSYVFLKEFIVSDMCRRVANWMCVEIMTETRKQTGGDVFVCLCVGFTGDTGSPIFASYPAAALAFLFFFILVHLV